MHLRQRGLVLLLYVHRSGKLQAVAHGQHLRGQSLDAVLAGIGHVNFRATPDIVYLGFGPEKLIQFFLRFEASGLQLRLQLSELAL